MTRARDPQNHALPSVQQQSRFGYSVLLWFRLLVVLLTFLLLLLFRLNDVLLLANLVLGLLQELFGAGLVRKGLLLLGFGRLKALWRGRRFWECGRGELSGDKLGHQGLDDFAGNRIALGPAGAG